MIKTALTAQFKKIFFFFFGWFMPNTFSVYFYNHGDEAAFLKGFKGTLYLVYLSSSIGVTIYTGLLSIFTENSVKLAYRRGITSNYFVFL